MSARAKPEGPATVADLLALMEEDGRYELIGGELIEKEAASFEHGEAQSMLSGLLFPFSRRPSGVGPGGWWFAVDVAVQFGPDVCRPDVSGWRRERLPERPLGVPIPVAPDWTCEVLSTNRRNDLVRKKHIYHRHQVGHYWIIDPQAPQAQTLLVNRWHPDGYLEVLAAERGQKVRAEPFDAIELPVGVLFGDDDEEG